MIEFMRKIDNLTFVEAVERLADRVGIQLRYTDDTGARPEPGARVRMAEALRLAAEFFAEQLATPTPSRRGSSWSSGALTARWQSGSR